MPGDKLSPARAGENLGERPPEAKGVTVSATWHKYLASLAHNFTEHEQYKDHMTKPHELICAARNMANMWLKSRVVLIILLWCFMGWDVNGCAVVL